MNDTPHLISLNECCRLTSLSRTAINKHRAKQNFPRPVMVSESRIAFVRAEVVAWIEQRIADRDGRAA